MQERHAAVVADYDRSEDHLKALQSVGQIIGEVLRVLEKERFIVKASSGPRYVVRLSGSDVWSGVWWSGVWSGVWWSGV